MPQTTNGALECPIITTINQVKKIDFKKLCFKPFIFSDYQKNNQLKYECVSEVKNVSGVYVMKDIDSNKILHLGSSKKDLYEQIALAVQHYKVYSGQGTIALLKVEAELIDSVIKKIKLTHRSEPIDKTFSKVKQLVLEEKYVPPEFIDFFPLYNESPVGPRPFTRIKSNISHLRVRRGIYILQMAPKAEDCWHIEYVGLATDLHKRLHAHFIKSQAEYRPTSNYYYLRETHDFKIGIIEFPQSESGLISRVEDYLIKQWDPPGNRYGRGLTKDQIASLSTAGGWTPVEGVEDF